MYAVVAVLAFVILAAVAGLLTYTRRGRARVGGTVVSVGFFCTITVALVARGGMTSNSAAWLLLALPAGLPPEFANIMLVVDYPIVAGVIAGLLWVQAGVWDRVIAELDNSNKKLRDEVVERERAESSATNAAQARYTFLATMSHEIRTPLNGVLGLTDVLLDTDLDEDQLQLTKTVQDSGELLRALLDDVLDFSKIDSGRLEVEAVPVNLRRVCDDIVDLWQGPAGEGNLKLEFLPEADAPRWVVGDPIKLKQVLGNLVSNAIKFTDDGHVHIILRGGDQLILEVQDSGIGLDPAASEHIFDPFRQADSTTTRR